MKQSYSLTINAPLEKAFNAVVDEHGRPRMSAEKETQTTVYDQVDPDAVEGVKYHLQIGGLDFEGEVIAYKRPDTFGVGLKHFLLSGTFFYHFASINDGTTRLDCELEIFDGTAFRQEMTKISLPALNRLVEAQLNGIKAYAEKS